MFLLAATSSHVAYAQDVIKFRKDLLQSESVASGRKIFLKFHPINENLLDNDDFRIVFAVVSKSRRTVDTVLSNASDIESFANKICKPSADSANGGKKFKEVYFKLLLKKMALENNITITNGSVTSIDISRGDTIAVPGCLEVPNSYPVANYNITTGNLIDARYNYPATIYTLLIDQDINIGLEAINENLKNITERRNSNGITFNSITKATDTTFDLEEVRKSIKNSYEIDEKLNNETQVIGNAVVRYINVIDKSTNIKIPNLENPQNYKFSGPRFPVLLPVIQEYDLGSHLPHFVDIYELLGEGIITNEQSQQIFDIFNSVDENKIQKLKRYRDRVYVSGLNEIQNDGNTYFSLSPIASGACSSIANNSLPGLNHSNILEALQRSISKKVDDFKIARVNIIDTGFLGIDDITTPEKIPLNYISDFDRDMVPETHGTSVVRHALGQAKTGEGFSTIYEKLKLRATEIIPDQGSAQIEILSRSSAEREILNISMGTEKGLALQNLVKTANTSLIITPSGNYTEEIRPDNYTSKSEWVTKLDKNSKDRLIVVAGLDQTGEAISNSSNYSETYVDIAAPSECVSFDLPNGIINLSGLEGEVRSQTIRSHGTKQSPNTGTSFAAPQVTYGAWLLDTIYPSSISGGTAPVENLKQRIMISADREYKLKDKVENFRRLNIVKALSLYEDIGEHKNEGYLRGDFFFKNSSLPNATYSDSLPDINCGGTPMGETSVKSIGKIFSYNDQGNTKFGFVKRINNKDTKQFLNCQFPTNDLVLRINEKDVGSYQLDEFKDITFKLRE